MCPLLGLSLGGPSCDVTTGTTGPILCGASLGATGFPVVVRNLLCTLSSAHLGYMHLVRAFLRCCISLLRSSGLVWTVFGLWVRVLITLYLAVKSTQTGHSTTPLKTYNIIGREDYGLARTIKESIYIRVRNPTLNSNIGKYNLHHIWGRVLFNTPDLKINNDNGYAHRTGIIGHAQSIPTNRHLHTTLGHTGHALDSEHVHRTS